MYVSRFFSFLLLFPLFWLVIADEDMISLSLRSRHQHSAWIWSGKFHDSFYMLIISYLLFHSSYYSVSSCATYCWGICPGDIIPPITMIYVPYSSVFLFSFSFARPVRFTCFVLVLTGFGGVKLRFISSPTFFFKHLYPTHLNSIQVYNEKKRKKPLCMMCRIRLLAPRKQAIGKSEEGTRVQV
jgi:hypothetical protein